MAGILDRIYSRSPIWVQNFGISLYGEMWRRRRFGGVFQDCLNEFRSRESFSSEEWQAHQAASLASMLDHAFKTVPYYREKWKDLRLERKAVFGDPFSVLSRLPILPKEDIRSNPDAFVSDPGRKKKLHTYLTSGTTGTPLSVKFSTEMHQTWSAAYEARCRNWAGVDNSMSRAMIGGRLVVPDGKASPPYWRYNWSEKQLYFSAFHISPQTAQLYVQALNQRRPDYYVGYASSWFFLARFIVEQNLKAHKPKAVLTSSEKLTPDMRACIEKAFGCKVFDGYSGVEACCLASECECGNLHISPDVGFIELLDDNGDPVPRGCQGEIVATGFLNRDQPLIRYRTGDLAILSDKKCSCGRSMPILEELVGRLEDTVIGFDGREMVRFHGIFVGMPHVKMGQVIQETLKEFRLKLEVTSGFGENERAEIRKRFVDRLGPVEIHFEYVDAMELTQRGKFQAVVSHVNRQ